MGFSRNTTCWYLQLLLCSNRWRLRTSDLKINDCLGLLVRHRSDWLWNTFYSYFSLTARKRREIRRDLRHSNIRTPYIRTRYWGSTTERVALFSINSPLEQSIGDEWQFRKLQMHTHNDNAHAKLKTECWLWTSAFKLNSFKV